MFSDCETSSFYVLKPSASTEFISNNNLTLDIYYPSILLNYLLTSFSAPFFRFLSFGISFSVCYDLYLSLFFNFSSISVSIAAFYPSSKLL